MIVGHARPAYLVAALGKQPAAGEPAARWQTTAGRVEAWRQRADVTDITKALPRVADPVLDAERRELDREIRDTARELGVEVDRAAPPAQVDQAGLQLDLPGE